MFRPFAVERPCFPERKAVLSAPDILLDEDSPETGRRNARTIQKAIDQISAQGGGHVILPAGFCASSPFMLKSNVDLHLERGAFLKFTKCKEDYPLILTEYEGEKAIRAISPITADHVDNIAITGEGIIDGSGDLWRPVKKFKLTERQWNALLGKKDSHVLETKESIWIPTSSSYEGVLGNIQGQEPSILEKAAPFWDFYRPVMVSLRHSSRILLEGVTFQNSPAWNIHPLFCQHLTLQNLSVKNDYWAQNGDGVDVESCQFVEIAGCCFETGDDAICIKSGKNAPARCIVGPSTSIHVHDCTVYQGHGGFVVGSEMSRGVENVLVERCLFAGTDVGVRFKSALGRGGVVENIEIRDIRMVGIKGEAIILTMGYVLNRLNNEERPQMADEADIPYFRNIRMSGMHFLGQKVRLKMEPISWKPETISDIVINGKRYDGPVLLS